jgi:hypothetical protein
MAKHHRVRTHHWRLGRLEVKDQIFESEAEALAFANSIDDANSVKIFDHENQVKHIVVDPTASTESYA